jgi:DNA-binding SARP family transcriptional activator/tetratricopeptide (TPR) repeat protein
VLRLLTFGELSLRNGDRIATGAGAQRSRLSILAVLAAAGDRGVARDKLLGYFWANSSQEQARQALKQASYALRRTVDAELFSEGSATLCLNRSVITSDVDDFLTASAAKDHALVAALWRGPFLDGIYVRNAPEFERWVETERDRLARLLDESLEQLAARAEGASAWSEAIAWRRRLVERDRLSSRATRALMETLAAAGDSLAALEEARIYEARVLADLGAGADPAIAELCSRIRGRASDRRIGADMAPSRSESPDMAPAGTMTTIEPSVPRRGSRRRLIALGILAIGAGAAAIAWTGFSASRDLSYDLGRILVLPLENRSTDSALASLGRAAGESIADGIRAAGFTAITDSGTTEDARTVVYGQLTSRPDSFVARITVADVRSGRVRLVIAAGERRDQPTHAWLTALRARVAGGIATLSDARLAVLSDPFTSPPTIDAYRDYASGLAHFAHGEYDPALKDFQRVASTDSLFAGVLVWQAYSFWGIGRSAQHDSVVNVLQRRRPELSALQRSALDYFLAVRGRDRRAKYENAVRAARLAPHSEWVFNLAEAAMEMGKFDEAVDALGSIDLDSSWHRGWYSYTTTLVTSLHMIGDHRRELAGIVRARKAHPDNFLRLHGMALAAMGDTSGLRALLNGDLKSGATGRPDRIGLFLQFGANELQRHGHHAAAAAFFRECVSWGDERSASVTDSLARRFIRAECLYGDRRWDDARRAFEIIAKDRKVGGWQMAVQRLSVLAIRRGDPAGAAEYARQIQGHSILTTMPPLSAVAAAIRGDRARALAEIQAVMTPNSLYGQHLNVDVQALWNYPPYVNWISGRR